MCSFYNKCFKNEEALFLASICPLQKESNVKDGS